ncbi:MAG: endonuclease MutS2 [Oscillospiraceae bacterium]|nr:endonuclease MutS2 [Oscillospiraceae bacterium]
MTENRHYRALELDKILTMLSECTGCEDSRRLALETEPKTTIREAKRLMDRTADAFMLSARFGAPSLHGVKNVTGSLKRAQMGATLSLPELIDIERFLKALREMKDFRNNYEGEEATSLDEFFESLMPNQRLEEKIGFTVVSEDEVSDTASPTLADIRRKIRNSQAKVKDQLDKLIHSNTYAKYLQEPIVTMRDGRYCVPVKAEYRNEIKGMVHDTSGTGATIFIEPAGVVDENNETRVLKAKEQQEIQRILYELSCDIGNHAATFIEDYSAIVELDLYFAKARLASKMNASVPNLSDDGKVRLSKARHPLIDKNKIVPIDIALGYDYDVLVITGPNTGGKTVALKTIGLLTLMAMCGLMIPAGESSSVSVFENVFADIGDEQSIEQSLSTFSSHINNTIKILEKTDDRSLVLLDELGAGTDPIEGAALAVAIIERLKLYGAKVAATTHYAEIKMYALQTPRVENACCEFNVETLSPTYRLLVGVPGKSNAFAITERLGMDGSIVDRARELVSAENANFEDVVEKLEQSRQELEKEHEKAENYRKETERIRLEIAKEKEEMERSKEKELEAARLSAKRLVEQVRAESQKLIDEIIETKKAAEAEASADMAARARAQMKSGIARIQDIADPIAAKDSGYRLPRNLVRGDTVRINGMSKDGTLVGLPDGAGYCLVQTGIVKSKVHISELRLIENNKSKKNTLGGGSVTKSIESASRRKAASEVDLRGMDVEQGLLEMDRFLDECVLLNLNTVSVIHGKGTGVLRAAVHQALKKNKAVKSFRLGVYGEGETGVTIVELK